VGDRWNRNWSTEDAWIPRCRSPTPRTRLARLDVTNHHPPSPFHQKRKKNTPSPPLRTHQHSPSVPNGISCSSTVSASCAVQPDWLIDSKNMIDRAINLQMCRNTEYSARYLVQLLGFENALCWRAKRAYGTQTQQALIPTTAQQDDVSCGWGLRGSLHRRRENFTMDEDWMRGRPPCGRWAPVVCTGCAGILASFRPEWYAVSSGHWPLMRAAIPAGIIKAGDLAQHHIGCFALLLLPYVVAEGQHK